MRYFISAFTVAIGWNVGVLVYKIIERSLYKLLCKYIPKENRNKRDRVSYIDYTQKR